MSAVEYIKGEEDIHSYVMLQKDGDISETLSLLAGALVVVKDLLRRIEGAR